MTLFHRPCLAYCCYAPLLRRRGSGLARAWSLRLHCWQHSWRAPVCSTTPSTPCNTRAGCRPGRALYRLFPVRGLLAAGLVCRFSVRLPLQPVGGCRCVVLPAGVAFPWRAGLFLNGCCAGIATNSVLGGAFPATEQEKECWQAALFIDSPAAVRVWPTQLFELGLALLGVAVIWPLSCRLKLAEGSAALLYAVWFTVARWAILPLRSLPYGRSVTDVFYPVLYGAVILACGALMYGRNKKY